MFRKGCLAVCFLLWRLFDCSSTTAAAAATSSSTSSRQQQGAAGRQQQAAAGSSRQQQAAADTSRGSSSRQQQAAAGSGRQRQSCNFISSRLSEVTLGPFLGFLCYVLGTKLGGVLLFRMCFEKGVWLFVSCFGGCLIAAAPQHHSSSSRQQQAAAGNKQAAAGSSRQQQSYVLGSKFADASQSHAACTWQARWPQN